MNHDEIQQPLSFRGTAIQCATISGIAASFLLISYIKMTIDTPAHSSGNNSLPLAERTQNLNKQSLLIAFFSVAAIGSCLTFALCRAQDPVVATIDTSPPVLGIVATE